MLDNQLTDQESSIDSVVNLPMNAVITVYKTFE